MSSTRLSPHLTSSSVAALSHSSELDGLRLSPHFTLAEMTKTSVKTAGGNKPNGKQVENLRRVCRWLERLRQRWNETYGNGDDPVIINSGYRCPEVNKAVGGWRESNHLTGCAADIRCQDKEQALRYAALLQDIGDITREAYDEIIIEKKNSYWLHFAVRPKDNRRRTNFKR